MSDSPALDILRRGLLVDGRYKLYERIPRWLASRRYIAKAGEDRVQILFFLPDQAPLPTPEPWANFLAQLSDDSFWLKPLSQGEVSGLHYTIVRDVRGQPLADLILKGQHIAADDAGRFVRTVAQNLRPLLEQGLPVPDASVNAILAERHDRAFRPTAFPLHLPGHPCPPSEKLCEAWRKLLYQLAAHRPPPSAWSEACLAFLPPLARRAWRDLFLGPVSWDALENIPPLEHHPLPSPHPASLTPTSGPLNQDAEPDITAPHPATPSPRSESSSRRRKKKHKSPLPPGRKPPFTLKKLLPPTIALAALTAAAWFGWQLITSLSSDSTSVFGSPATRPFQAFDPATDTLNPQDPSQPQPSSQPDSTWAYADLPSHQHPDVMPETAAPTAPDTPITAPSPSNPTLPTTPPTSSAFNPRNLPQDQPGKIGSALPEWAKRYAADPANPDLTRAFENYLSILSAQVDSLRSGRLPDALQNLEIAAESGFPPARFLLGQALWGRDSRRSETLMTTLAREGYGPARVWCSERSLEWSPPAN